MKTASFIMSPRAHAKRKMKKKKTAFLLANNCMVEVSRASTHSLSTEINSLN